MDISSVNPNIHGLGGNPAGNTPEKLSDHKELIQAVKALNATELFGQNNELTFVINRDTHRPVMRIINRKTKEVIQQVPPEYIIRLAEDVRTKGV